MNDHNFVKFVKLINILVNNIFGRTKNNSNSCLLTADGRI